MGLMQQFQQPQASLAERMSLIKGMAKGDANWLISYLMQINPDFRSFMGTVQGKTPQQAFQEHGLDFSQFSGLL